MTDEQTQETIETIIICGNAHEVGDTECGECWSNYPKPCKCGGLVHTDFGDEDADCNYWLYCKCDKCGDQYEESE